MNNCFRSESLCVHGSQQENAFQEDLSLLSYSKILHMQCGYLRPRKNGHWMILYDNIGRENQGGRPEKILKLIVTDLFKYSFEDDFSCYCKQITDLPLMIHPLIKNSSLLSASICKAPLSRGRGDVWHHPEPISLTNWQTQ